MKVWSCTMPLEPVAKGRPRFSFKSGRTYTDAKTRASEESIRYFLHRSDPFKFLGAVAVEFVFSFVRPKSASVKNRPHMTVGKDIDNLVKQVADAANDILWLDDRQIIKLVATKQYAESASIYIHVSEVI